MVDPELIRAEKEYLLSIVCQLQQRIEDFNQNVDSAERLSASKFSSWKSGNADSKEASGSHVNLNRSPTVGRPRPLPSPLGNLSPQTSQGAHIQNLTQGSNKGVVNQQGQEGADENFPPLKKQLRNGAPAAETYTANRSNTSQQEPAASEPETQFKTMRKRNPTWAQVTDQNTKKLDPFARFADIQFVENFDRAEVEEILDGLISNSLPVENSEAIREEDIVDPVSGFDHETPEKHIHRYLHDGLKEVGRNHIFANAPYYMGDPMVYVLPWDPSFNPNELRTRSVPIWVELSDVPPNCA
ncbi:hypothetical protein R1sor_008394 [Riccia sorocarpa]|uniref:Uncharacterized protein n=1 Tax=Riccia sorocarpa TaxID=122646 RepID=A0ABD3HT92_9MARC